MQNTTNQAQPPKMLDQVVAKMHAKHDSLLTEKTYVDWNKRYIWHFDKRHPKGMGAAEVEVFLTHLALDRNVTASMQNQAKSTLFFIQ